jgi:hypothetical protein
MWLRRTRRGRDAIDGRDRYPQAQDLPSRARLTVDEADREPDGTPGRLRDVTRNARRPLLLLLTGAVAPAFALTACASASSTASSTASAGAHVAIPATAQTVTLSLNYGGNADGRIPPAPVTVTSPAKVSEVAGLVAGQPPKQPSGAISCPASDGKALTLVFRADPGGRVVATAVLGLDGCEFTDLTVSAKDRTLGEYGSARSMADRVLAAAGVAWKLPPFAWPIAS